MHWSKRIASAAAALFLAAATLTAGAQSAPVKPATQPGSTASARDW